MLEQELPPEPDSEAIDELLIFLGAGTGTGSVPASGNKTLKRTIIL